MQWNQSFDTLWHIFLVILVNKNPFTLPRMIRMSKNGGLLNQFLRTDKLEQKTPIYSHLNTQLRLLILFMKTCPSEYLSHEVVKVVVLVRLKKAGTANKKVKLFPTDYFGCKYLLSMLASTAIITLVTRCRRTHQHIEISIFERQYYY